MAIFLFRAALLINRDLKQQRRGGLDSLINKSNKLNENQI